MASSSVVVENEMSENRPGRLLEKATAIQEANDTCARKFAIPESPPYVDPVAHRALRLENGPRLLIPRERPPETSTIEDLAEEYANEMTIKGEKAQLWDIPTNFSPQDVRFSLEDEALTRIETETLSSGSTATPSESIQSHASIFQVYHQHETSYVITPIHDPYRELCFKNAAARKAHRARKKAEKTLGPGEFLDEAEREAHERSYFLHSPFVAFHSPPRTLRRGSRKDGPTVCLIDNSWFWRKWKLAFGDCLTSPDVIDPRGVVRWEHNQDRKTNQLGFKGYKVRTWRMWGESGKQYHRDVNADRKERSLSLKEVKLTNKIPNSMDRDSPLSPSSSAESARKGAAAVESSSVSICPDLAITAPPSWVSVQSVEYHTVCTTKSILQKEPKVEREISIASDSEPTAAGSTELARTPLPLESPSTTFTPAMADEIIYLTWTSPLSKQLRRYQFTYNNIDFYWKGTGTVKESRRGGFFCHFNHLKLIAALPLKSSLGGMEHREGERDEKILSTIEEPNEESGDIRCELCIAKYTSSIAPDKCGTLKVFDIALLRLVKEYMPELSKTLFLTQSREWDLSLGDTINKNNQAKETMYKELRNLKKARIYDLVIATAMCMIIGEAQKREAIKKIAELVVAEGAGNAGGGGG